MVARAMLPVADVADLVRRRNVFRSLGTAPPVDSDSAECRRVTLADLDTAHHPSIGQAVALVRRWAERRRSCPDASLVLCGPVGVGKTHMARAALWSVCYVDENGRPVAPVGRFVAADTLAQALGDAGPDDVIPDGTPMLVIDDVGTERRLPYVDTAGQSAELRRRYEAVINRCYELRCSVILTTNLNPAQLAAHVGPRAWDRLGVMAPRGFIFEFADVPSFRQRQGGRA